jgi:hypothetical protein
VRDGTTPARRGISVRGVTLKMISSFRSTVGGLAALTLVAGGIVIAAPDAAMALGSMGLSLSASASSLRAGTPWVLTGTATNTGVTDVTGLTSIAGTNRGHIVSVDAPCQITNVGSDNATGYGIVVCPDSSIYPTGVTFPPGFSYTAHVTVDTTGLQGQSITYTGHVNSPDIPGGRTADFSATVIVTDPGPSVSITAPPDGHLLDNFDDTTVSADATATLGATITSVDFYVDGTTLLDSVTDPPYETILPVHSLSDGSHTLTATVSDSADNSASDTISVTQGVGPTATITSPLDGATLDTATATTFGVTATPSTDAAVTSVDFFVDDVPYASLATPVDPPSTYSTSIPPNLLSAGDHTLSVVVNDSIGESASATVTVTQPPVVGPIVTVKAPLSFDPSFFDSPTIFKTVTTLQTGDSIQSVVWDVDGTPLAGASTLKPFPITVDPATLGPGTHALNVTVTSAHGVGSDSLAVTVPRATLSLDDASAGDDLIDPLSPEFVPGPDPTSDAAWVVPVKNTGDGTARSVTLELAAGDGSTMLGFDLGQMPGCSAATVFGGLTGVSCSLGDIASGATRFVPARIPTNGMSEGTQLLGVAGLDSSNADLPAMSTLGPTVAIVPTPVLDGDGNQIAAAEFIGVATSTSTQTATLVNTTDPVSQFNQLVIKFLQPRRVASSSLTSTAAPFAATFRAFALITTATKIAPTPPVAVSLAAGDPTDPVLCPPPSGCKGLPASVKGDFAHFTDRVHPIKVTVSTFLAGAVKPNPLKGIAGTVGDVYFVGADGTFQLTGATGRAMCTRNPLTKAYATPCMYGKPKYKTVLDVSKHAIGVIAIDTVLFVGGDPTITRH